MDTNELDLLSGEDAAWNRVQLTGMLMSLIAALVAKGLLSGSDVVTMVENYRKEMHRLLDARTNLEDEFRERTRQRLDGYLDGLVG